jgi:hypothetical protein
VDTGPAEATEDVPSSNAVDTATSGTRVRNHLDKTSTSLIGKLIVTRQSPLVDRTGDSRGQWPYRCAGCLSGPWRELPATLSGGFATGSNGNQTCDVSGLDTPQAAVVPPFGRDVYEVRDRDVGPGVGELWTDYLPALVTRSAFPALQSRPADPAITYARS